MGRWARRFALAALAAAALFASAASSAHAYLYWGTLGSEGDVGRATLTGEGADLEFIASTQVCGVAVDLDYIYWINGSDVGRAEIDGENPDPDFLDNVNAFCGIAVDANRIYWSTSGSIFRADKDGTNVAEVTAAPTNACGVAVDSSHVYWGKSSTPLTIGRSQLDGGNANDAFIPGAGTTNGCGVAVNSSHIFWANAGDTGIGRANLDGTSPDPTWIDIPGTPSVVNVAIDATHLYWANQSGGSIGRYDIDGTNAVSLLSGVGTINGLALDALAPPPPTCQDLNPSTAFEQSVGINLDCAGELTLTYEIVGPPANGQLSGFDASTGAVTYTPDAGFNGQDTFTYRASNAGGPSNTATVTVNVAAPVPPCPAVTVGLERWSPSPPFGRRPKAPGLRARLTTSVPASVLFDTTILFGDSKLPLRRRTLDVQDELIIRALLRGKALRELSPGDPARLRVAVQARPLAPSSCPRQDRVELTVSTRVKRVSKKNALARALAGRLAAF